jgi:inositol-phosphate transport system permease protein
VGYLWLIIATFSYRTEGLLPLDGNNNIGGLTLENWEAIFAGNIAGRQFEILPIVGTSLGIAIVMTVIVLIVSSMAGYALSRMNFPGRKFFLSFTLILHGFPAVTLIIPIFFILLNLGKIPVIGGVLGFNTVGGIAMVMVAFELPLGIWLMKGFFDNIPWDIERSAMIDGASRWRTYWEILLPQIRPGLLSLGIFSFIGGWNAYIIPATYSVGSGVNNLPVFLNSLTGDTATVDWNQVATVGLFQLIPIFIFFIFAQEYLLNIYAGGTKGSS